MNETISLSEKLYLLAINPEKGGIYWYSSNAIEFVIGGGLIIELLQKKCIAIEDKKLVVQSYDSQENIHKFALDRIALSTRQLKISIWIRKFHFSYRKIRRLLQEGLVAKRLIRLEEKSFLFFHWKKPVLLQKEVVIHIIEDIKRVIFNGNETEEDRFLLSLIVPAELMRRIFRDRGRRKLALEKIKLMKVENPVSIAVNRAIHAARAAHVAAVS